MSFRGRNGFNRTVFYGGPRNPWNSIFFEPAISWARFIIGTTIHCQELQEHRKIWVEYNPRNRIEDLLTSLKDILGITADVELYLLGFHIPPHLNASFLLQVQEPIYLLPHGQTEFAFGSEGNVPGPTFQPETSAQVFLFNPPRTSTPVDPNRGREITQLIPGNLNPQDVIAPGNPVVELMTTPNSVTSPGVTVVQISELNSPGSTDSASEAASPLVRAMKYFPIRRKAENRPESPLKDENTPLEYGTVANETIPVRRSSRRLSKSLTTSEGESLNRKRTSLADVENVQPQAAKRLKSTAGMKPDNSDVNVSGGSPIMKKKPGRKSKKSTSTVAELPSPISVSVELEDFLLASKKTEVAFSGDTSTESTGIMDIEWQSSLMQEEILEITQVEAIDHDPIEEATTRSMSHQSTTGEATETSNVRDHNLSCTMQSEEQLNHQAIGSPQHMESGVITSAASIEPGNVIRADMVVTGEDGNQTVTTKVMQVLAKYNDTVSVQIPSPTLGEVAFDEISRCSCCSPHGVFSVSFKDLIRPKILDEAELQNLLDAHNLATHY
ncbi:unnamed protein product [Allacma fusca]|uniref:Uncharacterized protein n=1 Tax=Allacma fusca TaxID=39272 RepID=A0A8J2LF17_9HEXA|nr:unnamed protein product [Allacma fusca]